MPCTGQAAPPQTGRPGPISLEHFKGRAAPRLHEIPYSKEQPEPERFLCFRTNSRELQGTDSRLRSYQPSPRAEAATPPPAPSLGLYPHRSAAASARPLTPQDEHPTQPKSPQQLRRAAPHNRAPPTTTERGRSAARAAQRPLAARRSAGRARTATRGGPERPGRGRCSAAPGVERNDASSFILGNFCCKYPLTRITPTLPLGADRTACPPLTGAPAVTRAGLPPPAIGSAVGPGPERNRSRVPRLERRSRPAPLLRPPSAAAPPAHGEHGVPRGCPHNCLRAPGAPPALAHPPQRSARKDNGGRRGGGGGGRHAARHTARPRALPAFSSQAPRGGVRPRAPSAAPARGPLNGCGAGSGRPRLRRLRRDRVGRIGSGRARQPRRGRRRAGRGAGPVRVKRPRGECGTAGRSGAGSRKRRGRRGGLERSAAP